MAVIDWTSDGRKIKVLLLGLWMVIVTVRANPSVCENAKLHFEAEGFAPFNLSAQLTPGATCSGECCSANFEDTLSRFSRERLDSFLKNSLHGLSHLLEVRAKRFDGDILRIINSKYSHYFFPDFFKNMMVNSKKEFHEMFKKTYGIIYIQNSFVFTDLFEDLEKYYSKGQVRLVDAMDNFFTILYQRMFTVINSQYQFDEKYLGCVAEHMAELKPFGDVPHKLSIQLRRSFVATRALYRAMVKGAEIVRNMWNLKLDDECGRGLVRMSHCASCLDIREQPACSSFCVSTLQTCLRHYSSLDAHWNNYIDALDKVSDRLAGPFNIEVVVEPINIKISEAIMNFQESGPEVSQRVFAGCGNPVLGRRRRLATEPPPASRDEIKFQALEFKDKKKRPKVEEKGPSFGKLVREIKQKVKETRGFWGHLSYQHCNDPKMASAPSVVNCWNGTENRSTAAPATSQASPLLYEQLFTLQTLSSKLQSAYQGQDVDLADDTEDSLIESGSGSGDEEGSADREYDVETTRAPPRIPTSSTFSPEVVRSPTTTAASPTLTRALVQYILPIVVVWFGGAISDLL